MGTTNCAAFVMGGGRTQFDILIGVIEQIEENVQKAEILTEFHLGDGPVPGDWSEATGTEVGAVPHVLPHYLDRKADLLERLAQAKGQIDEIWYLVLEVIEAI